MLLQEAVDSEVFVPKLDKRFWTESLKLYYFDCTFYELECTCWFLEAIMWNIGNQLQSIEHFVNVRHPTFEAYLSNQLNNKNPICSLLYCCWCHINLFAYFLVYLLLGQFKLENVDFWIDHLLSLFWDYKFFVYEFALQVVFDFTLWYW